MVRIKDIRRYEPAWEPVWEPASELLRPAKDTLKLYTFPSLTIRPSTINRRATVMQCNYDEDPDELVKILH